MKRVKTFFALTIILLLSIFSISSSEILQTASALSITGTSADEHIKGTIGWDYISGEGGNDFIQGLAGPDSLYGRDGNDRLDGGQGNDKLSGGKGDDRIRGGIGNDILTGGPGADSFDCGPGNDSVEDYSVSEGDTVAANCEVVHFLNPSLVAYWKFDEGKGSITVDSSHGGNLGKVSGATWQSNTECIVGDSCLRFDGINDFMNGGNSPSLQISNDITVSAWIKKAPIAFEAEVCIGKYFNTPDTGWVLVYDTDGTVHFDGRDGSGIYKKSVGPVLDDNEWHFVTGQREGSVWKIYVDGTLRDANDVSYAGSINAISDNLYVGRYSPSSGYCEATIDDVRIFNAALSDEEILQIYQESLLQ